MLSWNDVIDYVKMNLALPSGFIELTDAEIQDYCTKFPLKEFSQYIPHSERVPVLPDDPIYQHPVKNNFFYLFPDTKGVEVIGIKEAIFGNENIVMNGHPIMGAASFSSFQWWGLSVLKSRVMAPYSWYSKVYKFREPNIIEVQAELTDLGPFTVEIETTQSPTLETLPIAMRLQFLDLCLAHVMMRLGRIRSMYGGDTLNAPFGTIPLRGEELYNNGKELRDKIVEKLQEESMPAVTIDVY